MTKVAIIYYSSTGNAYQLVKAAEEGARAAGAETRVRKVRELAPDEAIATNAGWQQHVRSTESVPHATLENLEWSDGYIFATPTRYGNISAQLKQFLDASGPLWAQGKLANKAVAGIAGAGNAHGGQETTLLALYNSMYHWGAVVVAPGYTDSLLYAAGGNPYGVSYTELGLALTAGGNGAVVAFADAAAVHGIACAAVGAPFSRGTTPGEVVLAAAEAVVRDALERAALRLPALARDGHRVVRLTDDPLTARTPHHAVDVRLSIEGSTGTLRVLVPSWMLGRRTPHGA